MMRPPVHPGEQIAVDLEESGMTPAELAEKLWVSESHLMMVLSGLYGIDETLAVRLAGVWGGSPAYWLQLQHNYETRAARNAMMTRAIIEQERGQIDAIDALARKAIEEYEAGETVNARDLKTTSFDDFLKEGGMYDEAESVARKRVDEFLADE